MYKIFLGLFVVGFFVYAILKDPSKNIKNIEDEFKEEHPVQHVFASVISMKLGIGSQNLMMKTVRIFF